jgi:hypothetical protein
VESLTFDLNDLYVLKMREYLREAKQRISLRDFYTAGLLYQRAARAAALAKKPATNYEALALSCFEKAVKRSLKTEDYSQAADGLERLARIYEQRGESQLAADLRLQASYLRLKGIETMIG